jgi:formylmethanofuran dehydrogenase subunit E
LTNHEEHKLTLDKQGNILYKAHMDDKYEALDRGYNRLAEKMFTRTERTDGLRVIRTTPKVKPAPKMLQCSGCGVMVHEERGRDGEPISVCPCCHVGKLVPWSRS